jgi:hypothetical protein
VHDDLRVAGRSWRTTATNPAVRGPGWTLAEGVDLEKKAREAGAVDVPVEILQNYAGRYRGDDGLTAVIDLHGTRLLAVRDDQPVIALIPVDTTSFRALTGTEGTVIFATRDGTERRSASRSRGATTKSICNGSNATDLVGSA